MDDSDDAADGDESDVEDDVAKENETNAKGERHVQTRAESETGDSTGTELVAALVARLGVSNAEPEWTMRNERPPSALATTKTQNWECEYKIGKLKSNKG